MSGLLQKGNSMTNSLAEYSDNNSAKTNKEHLAPATSVETLRARARQQVMDGAVTGSYALDTEEVIKLLNASLATEWVCALRYKRHYFVAKGIKARFAASEFLEHAKEELAHADRIAERIVQLGGDPDLDPQNLASNSLAEYHAGKDLHEMITEDLVAERIAIDAYRELVQHLGDRDPTTRRMLEDILANEEEHADDLMDLLEGDSVSRLSA
jgi:bacterioferritin